MLYVLRFSPRRAAIGKYGPFPAVDGDALTADKYR